ncbi:MAG: hypothetical protein IPO94_18400 [Saprospiraceae bacterium]|nr:hypothetical protein [Saprospiraceae bacterium]
MATQGKVKELTGELMKNLSTLTKPRIDLIGLFILAIVQVTYCKPRQDSLGDGYEK